MHACMHQAYMPACIQAYMRASNACTHIYIYILTHTHIHAHTPFLLHLFEWVGGHTSQLGCLERAVRREAARSLQKLLLGRNSRGNLQKLAREEGFARRAGPAQPLWEKWPAPPPPSPYSGIISTEFDPRMRRESPENVSCSRTLAGLHTAQHMSYVWGWKCGQTKAQQDW